MSTLFALQPHQFNGASDKLASQLLSMLTPAYLQRMSEMGLITVRDRLNNVLGDAARQQNMFVMPPAAELPPEPVNSDLATVLSPSQIERWRDCPASWYFRYVQKLEETSDSNRALGRAIHKAVEIYYKTYLEEHTRPDLATSIVFFRAALTAELEGPVVMCDGDTKESLDAEGVGLLSKYIAEVAHTVEPAKLEMPVEGKIGGVPVRGFIDILDVHGKVIDLKTVSKSPSSTGFIQNKQRIQLATYALLSPECSGEAEVTHIVKNKTPKIVIQHASIGPKDRAMVEKLYPLAQEGMRAGVYYPNRESFFCSKSKCSFWSACEKEYGGEVKP